MIQGINYKEAPLSNIHKKVFLCYVLGQITCGYTLSISGTALTQAEHSLRLNSFWMGLLGAGTLIGLFGSVIIGNIADKIGRSKLFNINMILFTVLSLLQFLTVDTTILFILRVCLGITVAIDYTVGSALLTEWLPEKLASKYQSYLIIYWMLGFVASYVVGLLITGFGNDTWKYIIISSAVPSFIAAVWRLKERIPESPAWLASIGKEDEANELVNKYIGETYYVEVLDKNNEYSVSWKELFSEDVRRNTLVGGVFWICQVFPFFGIGIFFPILVKNMNIGDSSVPGLFYNLFTILGAILGVIIFNKVSRRSYLLYTFYIASAALALLIVFQNSDNYISIILFSIVAIVLSASTVAENPYPAELFETRLRGSGVGAVIAMSRVGAALGTFLLPIIVSNYGVSATLGICVIVLLLGGIYCHIYAPETSPKFIKNKK